MYSYPPDEKPEDVWESDYIDLYSDPNDYPELWDDEIEEALDNCGLYEEGGIYHCLAAGSEECSFSCILRDMFLGFEARKKKQDEVESE